MTGRTKAERRGKEKEANTAIAAAVEATRKNMSTPKAIVNDQ